MKHTYDIVQTPRNGLLIPAVGVQVTVNQQGTMTPAVLYSDDGVTTTPNPVATDANGRFNFYVANGRYDLVYSGTGFTSFTQFNVEITDAMDTTTLGKTVIAFTANNTHSGAETFSGSLGIPSGASNPVSCSVGYIFYNTTLGSMQVCTAPNTFSGVGGSTPTPGSQITFGATVTPLAYGAKWDVKAVTDCTFTVSSSTITCPATEANFTAADLGKVAFGTTGPVGMTTGCNGASCGSVVVPQGFICTVNSTSSVTLGTSYPTCAANNATANCTPGASTLCSFLWGTQDDSTAIQSAAAAAWTGSQCKTLELPSGMAFFTVPSGGLFNVTIPQGSPCSGSRIADMTQAGPQVAGQGGSTSVLVPLPTVNFANCTGGTSGAGCITGPANWFGHDFGVWGFNQSDSGTTHTNNLIEFYGVQPSCTAAAAWNLSLSGWETASASSQGFVISSGCGTLYATNVISEGFGNTNCVLTGGNNTVNVNALDCFGSAGGGNGASLVLNYASGSATINSTGSQYWGVNGSQANGPAAVKITGGSFGTFNSFGDTIQGPTTGTNDYGISFVGASGNTVNLSGTAFNQTGGSGGASLIFCSGSINCNVSAYGATITASGASMQMFRTFGGGVINFKDACANSFTQGGAANSAINVFGSCSITGTNIAAGNLVLSAGWGTTAAWSALTGSTQQTNGIITASGTGQAANPTITYTFPTPFLQTPTSCFALQVGGTQAAVANPFTPSALSKSGVTLTYNGTPVAGNTLQVMIQCWNP